MHHPELFEAACKGYNIDTTDFVINTADNIRYREANYDQWLPTTLIINPIWNKVCTLYHHISFAVYVLLDQLLLQLLVLLFYAEFETTHNTFVRWSQSFFDFIVKETFYRFGLHASSCKSGLRVEYAVAPSWQFGSVVASFLYVEAIGRKELYSWFAVQKEVVFVQELELIVG